MTPPDRESHGNGSPDRGDVDLRRPWDLDEAIVFLNHGSFGACPRPVLERQSELRQRMEREPVRFFVRELETLADEAREGLACFLGGDPEDLAFVRNATEGVNTVAHSLALEPGDEILTTDHAYNACRNAIEFAASRRGARVVVARIPFPLHGPEDALQAILSTVTPRTRLALVDHVTSPTALVLPIGEIVRRLDALGVDTLVDAAHAPGMLALDLERLGAAYTTGNCHKWMCAPKGAAFLHVRRDRREGIMPLSISHGWNADRADRSRFRCLFDWTGTDDPTAHLCIPEAIRFLGTLVAGGWEGLRERNRRLALDARALLAGVLGVEPPCPEGMIGSMASLRLPPGLPGGEAVCPRHVVDPLQEKLFREFGVEVPVFRAPGGDGRILRVSAQAYNRPEEYARLADALERIRDA